jgi:hypothetical protein
MIGTPCVVGPFARKVATDWMYDAVDRKRKKTQRVRKGLRAKWTISDK